ncbi:hypothetical protein [Acidiphilium angustum]|uniref:hypothetical protein n=1 Tax=Acidiphilium angustum TaxID=523 RepID=UPI0004949844|nr:hypothetical protein [Acidiphilium angustum]
MQWLLSVPSDCDAARWARAHEISDGIVAKKFRKEMAAASDSSTQVFFSLWYIADTASGRADEIASVVQKAVDAQARAAESPSSRRP